MLCCSHCRSYSLGFTSILRAVTCRNDTTIKMCHWKDKARAVLITRFQGPRMAGGRGLTTLEDVTRSGMQCERQQELLCLAQVSSTVETPPWDATWDATGTALAGARPASPNCDLSPVRGLPVQVRRQGLDQSCSRFWEALLVLGWC